MIVRKPARSFDGEDSRIAVSEVSIGAILGQHKSRPDKTEFCSSLMEPQRNFYK